MPSPLFGPVLDAKLVGSPSRLGVIVATTTAANNSTTATPFDNTGEGLSGKLLIIQPDVACRVRTAQTSALAVATTTDLLIEANQQFPLNVPSTHKFLSVVASAGTVNAQVFELL